MTQPPQSQVKKGRRARPFSAHLWRPRGLFFKIFGWFLAGQLLIALALVALAATTQRGFDQRLGEILGANLEARTRAAAIAYEKGGPSALREAWQNSRPGPRVGSSPDDAPPDDALPSRRPPDDRPPGQPPGDALREMEPPRGGFGRGVRARGRFGRGARSRGGFGRGSNDPDAASLYVLSAPAGNSSALIARYLIGAGAPSPQLSLATRPTASPETLTRRNGTVYLIRRVETARGRRYAGVLRLRWREGRPGRLLNNWWGGGPNAPAAPWRFAVVGLTMGALCYALARYLTDPAIKLRRATQQFAAGDFAVRVGPQLGARRDELADLGRDFDQMAERIEGLLLSQRQLLGDISHELRSPLTRLSLALELATESADAPTRAFLTRIESEIGEMNRLIGQLLTIAKLENGASARQQNSREAAYIDLAHLIEHVAQNADFEARSHGGKVEITHLETCQIVGDGELLHSALENVVRNAILHSAEAPRIEISLHIETQSALAPATPLSPVHLATVRVRDYGPGVPEEALEQMFRPFFRIAAARDRQSGGTGLGLSITQRAARFHGGDVIAHNAQGGGLEVKIQLPVAVKERVEVEANE